MHEIFVTNDDLIILDCLFGHLIWSDVMICYGEGGQVLKLVILVKIFHCQ